MLVENAVSLATTILATERRQRGVAESYAELQESSCPCGRCVSMSRRRRACNGGKIGLVRSRGKVDHAAFLLDHCAARKWPSRLWTRRRTSSCSQECIILNVPLKAWEGTVLSLREVLLLRFVTSFRRFVTSGLKKNELRFLYDQFQFSVIIGQTSTYMVVWIYWLYEVLSLSVSQRIWALI